MNFISYLKEHIGYILFSILLIVGSGFLLLFLPTQNPIQVESQEITLFNISLNNWGIWLTIIGSVFACLWAMYQYTKATSLRQQEKASEIAKLFSDELLRKCNILIAVYENSPLSKLLKDVKSGKLVFKDFTSAELRGITSDDDFPSKYKNILESVDFDYLYFRVLEKIVTTKQEYKNKYKNIDNNKKSHYTYSTSEARNLFVNENSSLPFHFSSLVSDVLNQLEYVCINLSTHAAGSAYIYQSLHQIFFDTVNTLAFEISIRNNGKYSDKFYTNIIHVYKELKNIYELSTEKEDKGKEKNNQQLNPKIRSVN